MIKGLDSVLRNINKFQKKQDAKIEKALKEIGLNLLQESNEVTPMSPIDSGTSGDLRRSGRSRLYRIAGKKTARVTYGNARVNYALYVHEMPNTNNYTQSGTGNNYLLGTMQKNKYKYKKYLLKKARV